MPGGGPVTRLARALCASMSLLALLAAGTPARAADRVLIMTISEYPRQPLAGVKHDAQNALQLARRLGYDTRQALLLKDQQLTGVGLRQAFASLLGQVQQNDRVFVYFSGHGYSMRQGDNCVQGLVAQDLSLIPTAELSQALDGIKTRVSDALVIFDACHSGGNRDIAVTRAFDAPGSADTGGISAKVWTPRGGERCDAPTNTLAKAWSPSDEPVTARAMVFPKNNFTFIAAARDTEVALDDQALGGLATVGLMQCAESGVSSATGVVTAQDLAACAQQHVGQGVHRVNARLAQPRFTAHQLVVYGNESKIFDVRAIKPAATPGAAAPANAERSDRAEQVLVALRQMAANSNGNWGLVVQPTEAVTAVGQAVRVNFQTNQTGYVQLVYVGADRQDIKRVWPAQGQTRLLTANEGQLPISLRITAPAGDNTFLMVVSQTPMDLSGVLRGDSATADADTMRQLGCELIKRRNAEVVEDAPRPGACPKSSVVAAAPAANPQGIGGYTARLFTVRGR